MFHICCAVCAANSPINQEPKTVNLLVMLSEHRSSSSKWLFPVKMPRIQILCAAFPCCQLWVCSNCRHLSTSHLSPKASGDTVSKSRIHRLKSSQLLLYPCSLSTLEMSLYNTNASTLFYQPKRQILTHSKEQIHDTYYLLPLHTRLQFQLAGARKNNLHKAALSSRAN